MARTERLDRASLLAICRAVRENAEAVASESASVADLLANVDALAPDDKHIVAMYMTGVQDQHTAEEPKLSATVVMLGDGVDLEGVALEEALREHFPVDVAQTVAKAVKERKPVFSGDIEVQREEAETPTPDLIERARRRERLDHEAAAWAQSNGLAKGLLIGLGFTFVTMLVLALIVRGIR